MNMGKMAVKIFDNMVGRNGEYKQVPFIAIPFIDDDGEPVEIVRPLKPDDKKRFKAAWDEYQKTTLSASPASSSPE
jgi:hypothetical protein